VILISKMTPHGSPSRKPVGRPRKEASEKKQGKSAALHPALVAKMEAIRRVHGAHGYYPPTHSWMMERGLNLYVQTELARYPELKEIFQEIDTRSAQTPTRLTSVRKPDRKAASSDGMAPASQQRSAPLSAERSST
jgi:hypothetical protein